MSDFRLGLKGYVSVLVLFVLLYISPAALGQERLGGKIIETMNSGSYTYIQIEDQGAKQWVAVPQVLVRVGDVITLHPGMSMGTYTSPTLKRTFEGIIFSEGLISIKRPMGAGDNEVTPGGREFLQIEKAEGSDAYTIEEIYQNKKELSGKKVVVRGKVFRVSKYQGKNWIRIKDGTGSRKRGNHQLVATSEQTAEKGDVVTISGEVEIDKNFGALTYEVIVEDAKVIEQVK